MRTLLFVLIFLSTPEANAHNRSTDTLHFCTPLIDTFNRATVHSNPQKQAEFPGGQNELRRFISEHLEAPKEIWGGRIFLSFIVDTAGRIHNTVICQNQNYPVNLLDSVILAMTDKMPRWKPAFHNGQKVCSRVILPIIIDIE